MAPDPKGLDLKSLIKRLRTATLFVQLSPFVYGVFYIIGMITYLIGNEEASLIVDALFYVAPIIICEFLLLSKIFKLCRWHKIACCMPLIGESVGFLDSYIVDLSEIAAIVNCNIIIGSVLMLLYYAYKVFFINGNSK